MSDLNTPRTSVRIVRTGDVQIKSRHVLARRNARPARVLDVFADRTWSPRLPITCFVIEHGDEVFVVDTGESSHANDPGYQPWWHPFTRFCERRWVEPEEEVGPRLAQLGHPPGSVDRVLMTHMHGDHAGGLPHFEGVEILMSELEADAALGKSGPVNGYLNGHYPDWLSPTRLRFDRDPWETFDASIAITADGAVRLVPTPGHTLGHVSVVVDRGDDLVLLVGDASYSEAALLRGDVDGVAQSAKQHRESTARIRELCRRRPVIIVPTHDPDSPDRLATGRHTEISQ